MAMTDDMQRWREAGEELLQRMKGAPLSVFVALARHGEQGRPQLIERTRWSRGAVSAALDALIEMGLVQRTHFRGWALREGLDPSFLLEPAAHGQPAERTHEELSGSERAFDERSPERSPEGSWQHERMPQSLWDAESPSDGSWAQRLLESLSRVEGPPEDPSAGVDDRDVPGQSPRKGLSAAERTMAGRSAPYDDVVRDNTHKHDHLDHHEQHPSWQATENERLLEALWQLDPPFDDAEAWLRRAPLQLVGAWLMHLQNMDRRQRQSIRNEAAYIRAKVAGGKPPPRPHRPRRRTPCPTCGRTLKDAHGRCLVCAGVVMV